MLRKPISEVLPLTSLRFFLASWIVLFHLQLVIKTVPGTPAQISWWALFNVVHCAYVAVGIFFVLSGFILALNYSLDEPWTNAMRWKFAVARFSRIYPVYLLALAAVAPIVIGPIFAEHSRSLLLRRLVSGALNLLMLQAWVPQAALTWNGPGWSLSSEAFFYVCFPVLGALVYRTTTVRKAVAAIAGLWALELAAPVICVLLRVKGFGDMHATALPETTLADLVKFNPLLNLSFFLAGIAACRVYRLLRAERHKNGEKWAGRGYLFYLPSLVLLALITAFGDRSPYPVMHNGLILPPAVGIILGLALGDKFLCALLSNRLLVFLGKASYAEYLLHFPVRYVFERYGIAWSLEQQTGYFLTVLVISGIVFHFYEEPMQLRLRKLLMPRPTTSQTPLHSSLQTEQVARLVD